MNMQIKLKIYFYFLYATALDHPQFVIGTFPYARESSIVITGSCESDETGVAGEQQPAQSRQQLSACFHLYHG